MKKETLIMLILILSLNLALAQEDLINLQIEKETVNNVIVSELNNPATFNFKIKNLGPSDNFEIYSLVGVDMTPKGTFNIGSGQTKEIEVQVYALERARKKQGVLTFGYKIHGINSGIQSDLLTISIMPIQEAFELGSSTIYLNATQAEIFINNKLNEAFDIKAEMSSSFFESILDFHLAPLEVKHFNITLDKEKMKTLIAGQYLITAKIILDGKEYKITAPIRFAEQEGISSSETTSGILFRKTTIEKTNDGNVPLIATANIKKNIISRLFTTFNIEPEQVTRKGVYVYYVFQKEITPHETFTVKATTSWLYPLLLLLMVLIIAYLTYAYTVTDVIVKKRIAFVKTKGGEFALKVYLSIKARRFVEKIELNDKVPALVKVYEKFTGIPPDKVDKARRRIAWNIEALDVGEERVFSYIVYSKVSVIGKFELPPATAVYEREGKIKQAFSNKTYFMNEPIKEKQESI